MTRLTHLLFSKAFARTQTGPKHCRRGVTERLRAAARSAIEPLEERVLFCLTHRNLWMKAA